MIEIEELDWEKGNGLIPAVVQDSRTGRVLMLGYVDREALAETRRSGWMTFWSRSRRAQWTKGETSGNRLRVLELRTDCDRDALLAVAEPAGPTCHTGAVSCFGGDAEHVALELLGTLERLIQSRRLQMPDGSYTTRLFEQGLPRISRKLGEEAVELIVSAQEGRRRSVEESADLLYHLLVFLAAREIPLQEVMSELQQRQGFTPPDATPG